MNMVTSISTDYSRTMHTEIIAAHIS